MTWSSGIAMTAIDLFTDASLLQEAKRSFQFKD
jgi:hypothetical protein